MDAKHIELLIKGNPRLAKEAGAHLGRDAIGAVISLVRIGLVMVC